MNLKDIKKELREKWINDLQQLKDTAHLERVSYSYITLLREIENIETLHEETKLLSFPNGTMNNEEKNDITVEDQPQKSLQDNDEIESSADINYVFQRRLRGGIAIYKNGENEEIFVVPEKVCRNLDLQTNDIVRVERDFYEKGAHRFKKIEDEEATFTVQKYDMKEYKHAIVSYNNFNNKYEIHSYKVGNKEINIEPFPLQTGDIKKFKIEAGDRVDVAVSDHGKLSKVRWLYKNRHLKYEQKNKHAHMHKSRSKKYNNYLDK
ncbi:hypothetical protein [Staphylococcus agnetis]|uniref:hypothetical protein n=4 Tax=Staphylococcus agnetis TaxID=985762 RepID=UPI00208E8F18|nr:hypothetical protein [Staphylococcus agnetis]MCO4349233.1 hypothetical protein [Staphylococcus agnetis]